MTVKTIYIIRHPKVYNPNKLCYGQSEMPLEENFTVQFDWIKEQTNPTEATAFFSSPLRRCTKLASFLSDENFAIDNRILDVNFGAWEMKEWAEILPKELEAWQQDFVNYSVKKGECFTDVYERATAFFEEILVTHEQNNLVVVTHASIIRSFVSYVLDFPLENVYNLQLDYSSITKITHNTTTGISSLVFLNLTAEHVKTNVKD